MPRGVVSSNNLQKGSLLSNQNRVEAPFIKVTIGEGKTAYTFGVYTKDSKNRERYPNYVQSLQIDKVNGAINTYTLSIKYPVTQFDDPNFFEKIFANATNNRKITFSYGDASLPNYIFKNEEALITELTSQIDIKSSSISYNVKAISSSTLSLSSSHTWPAPPGKKKPSDLIKAVINDNNFHLLDIFSGMKNKDLEQFIASDDQTITIPTFSNVSTLEYITNLVSYMNPETPSGGKTEKSAVYTLTTYEDTTGEYGGPYFKITKVDKEKVNKDMLSTYNIDIGFPNADIITNFAYAQDNNWSIFYEYNKAANPNEYVQRIDSNGTLYEEYNPCLAGTKYKFYESDKTWWSKVTEFPITTTLTLKGLLKPAILMSCIKINVFFWGVKHISSGYYVITSQKDTIDSKGYFTTLGLLRIAADEG